MPGFKFDSGFIILQGCLDLVKPEFCGCFAD